MGMAASQARLLSITSRMADNELRSQIINNSKMRLATESSKVSEDYINALNSATMMMSNYDTAGESQYQKLTFNSLTSYSSYNNQYGLVNANGNIMVSEHDAAIYRDVIRTGGGLDEYLAAYGLEYTSTFFTENTFDGTSVPITYEDANGEIHNIGEYDIDDLKDMYYGNEDKNLDSYNNALQSAPYVNFSDYYNDMMTASTNYDDVIAETVNEDLFHKEWGDGNDKKSWETAYNEFVSGDTKGNVSDYQGALDFITDLLDRLEDENKLDPLNNWVKSLRNAINSLHLTSNPPYMQTTAKVTDLGDGKYQIGDYAQLDTEQEIYDDEGDVIGYEYHLDAINKEDDIEYEFSKNDFEPTPTVEVTLTETETEDDTSYSTKTDIIYKVGEDTASIHMNIDSAAQAQGLITQIFLEFEAGIKSAINRDAYADENANTKAAKDRFDAAFDKFVELVFGKNLSQADKNEIKANYAELKDPGQIIVWSDEHGIETSDDFNYIEQIFILDQLFNVYGEPSAGWIDTNNPDENADAKVQWYTNLYNRMEKGYVVLEDGLASSNEWIEFAFESGLVTMEQVDSNNNWVSTIYTNCSDITEVTDDAAVARAEAEYNKAMNNIENKDKRFDMELKNIDTEHNSLQTEYDSVKSVIDKNIERSFKIYS